VRVCVIETTYQLLDDQLHEYEHVTIEERFGFFWTARGAEKMCQQLNARVHEKWNSYQVGAFADWKANRRENIYQPYNPMDWADWVIANMEPVYSVKVLRRA